MAIAGITVTREAQPLNDRVLGSMLRALELGNSYALMEARALQAQLGALSNTGTASVWSGDEIIVACDAELVSGHSCTQKPDPAEIIANLYLRHGLELFNKLRGAFSFAIWDKRSQAMVIAVDRFAVRPLSYYADSTSLIFASQPRGIFASERVDREINPQAVIDFLNFSMVPAPQSAYLGLRKVPAGCYLKWKDGAAHIGRYWDLEYSETACSSSGDLAHELLNKMTDAVHLHSQETPGDHLGCFLSGGTDSSSVLGLLTRERGESIHAFSIGFSEERFNELEYARIAASQFRAHHHISVLTPDSVFQDIPALVAAYDEPFGNASVLPTYGCLKLAREQGISVMLAGDGGDELFGGNERYRTEQIFGFYKRIPSAIRRYCVEPLANVTPGVSIAGKIKRYIAQANMRNPDRYFQWHLLQKFPPEKILDEAVQSSVAADLLDIPRQHYERAPAHSELNRLLYIDIKMTLADNDLPKVARAAELAGVNVRFPLLDHPLAEFSGKLPVHLKVHGLQKRYLFKKATAGLLPEAILRKKKHGFGLPIGLWLKQHPLWRALAEDVLLDPHTYQRGYFQRRFIEELFRLMDADSSTYYGDLLWLFLVGELWHRRQVREEVAA